MENEIAAWISVISNVGFPVMVTMYLLIRFERKLENLQNVILELSKVIKNIK